MEVPQVLAEVGTSSQGLASARSLRQAGVSRSRITRAVAAGAVLRVCAHVYAMSALAALPRFVVTDKGVSPEYVAHARAALLSLGDTATACRRTAAALYGWGMLVEPERSLDVAVPHGRSSVVLPRVRPMQRRSLAREKRVVLSGTDPLWITTPVQTVLDCALSLPLLQAVVVCDSALRAGDVTVEELVRAVERLPGVKDAAKARRVVGMSDPESGSVLESVLRVRMVLAGISGFTSQLLVRDVPGQQVRVDFGFLCQGLVVEVDGAKWHPDPARDQARDNALAALGWRVLRFTWSQVVHEPNAVLAEILAALDCATPSFHLVGGALEEAA